MHCAGSESVGRKMQPRLDPGGFVKKQDVRIKRQGSRQCCSFHHASGQRGRILVSRSGNPTKPSLLLAKRSARGRARPTCSIKGRATFSKTVSDEYNAPFWNRMPNLRSIRARASHWARSRSRPRYGPRPNAASAARRRYARARISRCLTLPPRQGFPRAARPGLVLMDLLGSNLLSRPRTSIACRTPLSVSCFTALTSPSPKNSAAMASIRITMKIDCTTLDVVWSPTDSAPGDLEPFMAADSGDHHREERGLAHSDKKIDFSCTMARRTVREEFPSSVRIRWRRPQCQPRCLLR